MASQLKSQAIEIGNAEDTELAFEYSIEHGWSDGLPIIPPTADRSRPHAGGHKASA